MRYLHELPLSESRRLEIASSVMQELQHMPPSPESSPGAQAMRILRARLDKLPFDPVPAALPAMVRGHMTPEEMDRRPWWTAVSRFLQRLKKKLGFKVSSTDPLARFRTPRTEHEFFNEPWCRVALFRRIILAILVIGPALIAGPVFSTILPQKGSTVLEMILIAVFVLLLAWISIGFWTAMLGFATLVRHFDRMILTRVAEKETVIRPNVKTAILFPVCREDMGRVCAGIAATWHSLERAGQREGFDIFILSDTSQPDAWVEEEIAWKHLCQALQAEGKIFYRRRRINLKRKSGNVADFCRRFGKSYTYMVVMDADSVMSGETLKQMVITMEHQRRVGILQTAPAVTGRETLLARVQQFCNRAYGPMFAAGLHSMQLGDAQFWGHNAIIRIKPFMEHCALPRLPGKPPLGGDIMSHDFVESALMRRAGWGVWLAFNLPGSYEETPPTLLAELKRDRRWCTGNLQHLRLVFTRGLFPTHRVLFLNGAMSYISAFLWFLLLLLSTTEAILMAVRKPVYFPTTPSLFPHWPVWDPSWPLALLAFTAALLFLPKFFSAGLIIARGLARRYGGSIRLLLSIFAEMIVSTLLAPIRMLFHTKFVFFILMGRQSGWGNQQRDDRGTSWKEAFRFHWAGTLFALVWGGVLYLLNPAFFFWISPIVGSLVLSIPISVFTSRASWGNRLRRWGLFLTPEEIDPPRELRELAESNERFDRIPSPLDLPEGSGFIKAVLHPEINALHRTLLARRPGKKSLFLREHRDELLNKALTLGPAALSDHEKNELLCDTEMMEKLHTVLWELPEEKLASKWQLCI